MIGRTILVGAVAAAAIMPAAAFGGGYATAGLSPPPPDTKPGKAWNAELTILQHGRTPLDGVRPEVIIRPAGGGAQKTFPAKPTGEPGKYVARVVFPDAGRWTYVVDDGFSARHDFAPVTIGGSGASAPATAAGGDDGGIDTWLALALAAGAGLLATAAMLTFRRRRGSGTAVPAG